MFIDTHAHLDDESFDADREEVIGRSFAGGIEKIINIGAGLGSSERSVALAQKHENIFAAVGLHPEYFMAHGAWSAEHKNKLDELARAEKVVAIGEIGLDYHHAARNTEHGTKEWKEIRDLQKEGFIYQLELAKELNLPVVVHCRGERSEAGSRFRETGEAYEDTFQILQERVLKTDKQSKVVFHGFGGRLEFAKKMLEFENIYFSFNGNLTYAKPTAEILEVIKIIPLQKIMLETDCPYLSPIPHRGERNEPAFVRFTAEKIAEIKNVPLEEVERKTTENAKRFFRW